MEHNIAQRMKGRKMSWSVNGADNFDKMLSEKFSNRLFDTVDKIYRNIILKRNCGKYKYNFNINNISG